MRPLTGTASSDSTRDARRPKISRVPRGRSTAGITDMQPELSIVVLCYRAGEDSRHFAREVISELAGVVARWELILVANYLEGDTDDVTPRVVSEMASADARIKALTEVKQGMMGWDARRGLALATGDAIALVDGDGQMPARDLVRAYEILRAGDLDMVKTYRAVRHDGLLRRATSIAYNALYRGLFPAFRVHDVNSKPKIFTRQFLERLTLESDDWFLDAEIMIQARRLNCRLKEVPTTFWDLEGRKSFVRPRHIVEFIRNLAAARIKEFLVR